MMAFFFLAILFVAAGLIFGGSLKAFFIAIAGTGFVLLTLYAVVRLDIAISLLLVSPLIIDSVRDVVQLPLVNNVSLSLGLFILSVAGHSIMGKLSLKGLSFSYWQVFCLLLLVMLYESIQATQGSFGVSLRQGLVTYSIGPAIIVSGMFLVPWLIANNMAKTLHTMTALAVWVGVISFGVDKVLYGYQDKYSAGFWGTGNTVGNILIVLLPFLFYIRRRQARFWFFSALPFAAIAVILFSKSRGSILALGAMVLVWVVFFANISQKMRLIVSMLMSPIVLFVAWQESTAVLRYFASVEMIEIDVISSGRTLVWRNVVEYLQMDGRFLYGGGPIEFVTWTGTVNTQNHLLRLLTSVGIFGTLIVLGVYLWIFNKAYRAYRAGSETVRAAAAVVMMSAVGGTVIGMFSHFFVAAEVTAMFWVSVGNFIAATEKSRELGVTHIRRSGTQGKLSTMKVPSL